jgi:hypothetical protein
MLLILRSGDRDVGEDTPLVVDHVAVAAAGSLAFDDPAEPFGLGVVDIVEER